MSNRTPAKANGLRVTLSDGSTFVTGVESVARILRLTLYGGGQQHSQRRQVGNNREATAAGRHSHPPSGSGGARRAA